MATHHFGLKKDAPRGLCQRPAGNCVSALVSEGSGAAERSKGATTRLILARLEWSDQIQTAIGKMTGIDLPNHSGQSALECVGLSPGMDIRVTNQYLQFRRDCEIIWSISEYAAMRCVVV